MGTPVLVQDPPSAATWITGTSRSNDCGPDGRSIVRDFPPLIRAGVGAYVG